MTVAGGARLQQCRLIEFPRLADSRGVLSVVEGIRHVPFEIRRVFYVYDLPPGGRRGGHAHRALEQVIVCMAGALDVVLDDGQAQRRVRLDRPWVGLYVPPMVWAAQEAFAPGTVYLVLASRPYDEADYIRDYEVFRAAGETDGS